MKRKVVVSLLILIVAIMCCGCNPETVYKTTSSNPTQSYEHEDDITYKKDPDDITPVVYITRTGKRYHRFGCSHAKNMYVKLTVSQAIDRGYTACYFCCY